MGRIEAARAAFGKAVLIAALAVAGGGAAPAHATPTWLLPDLVPHKAGRMQYSVEDVDGSTRELLRFDAYVENAGPGTLEFVASDPRPVDGIPEMASVHQRVYHKDTREGPYEDLPMRPGQRIFYETAPAHLHWHFARVERYLLVDPSGRVPDRSSPKEDAGFCLTDDQRETATAPATPYYPFEFNNGCERGNPQATNVAMGVSPGWSDFYSLDLNYQWVDVSDTPPGSYLVRTIPDPDDLVAETNESNNTDPATDVPVTIPGFVAQPTAVQASPLTATSVRLPYDTVEPSAGGRYLGEPEFEIVDGPQHGRLDHSPGEWFRGGSVSYTPDPGYTGADTFRFAVRDSWLPGFPRTPAEASVSVAVGLGLGTAAGG